MPLYAFSCTDCGREFEQLLRVDETPACPNCGGSHAQRLISLIAKPAAGGPSEPSCPAMTGGTPCGAGCPALSEMS